MLIYVFKYVICFIIVIEFLFLVSEFVIFLEYRILILIIRLIYINGLMIMIMKKEYKIGILFEKL